MRIFFRTLFFFLLTPLITYAQDCDSNRYQEATFQSIDITEDVVYASADIYNPLNLPLESDLKLDIYEPSGDQLTKRPLVIMSFGGAYIFGDKSHADMQAWCDSLARYGYVAVAIDYRLGLNALSEGSAIRAMYRGVQDTRAAIRYMLAHQDEYKIDPNHIYLGGESAGAINALHTAFMTSESERPHESYGIPLENFDLGCLDCVGNDYQGDFMIKGLINLWGGVIDLNLITATEQIPTLHIHGENDLIVPYDEGYPFVSNFQLTFPYLYASQALHNHMDNLNIYNEYYLYEGEGHLFYGLPDGVITFPNEYWNPIWSYGHEFLFQTMAFNSPTPIGETEVNTGWNYTYTIPLNEGSTYCWSVEGGTIISENNNELIVQWNEGNGNISVTETNCIGVVGATSMVLQVASTVSNQNLQHELGLSISPNQLAAGDFLQITNPNRHALDFFISNINGKIFLKGKTAGDLSLDLQQYIPMTTNYYFLGIIHQGKTYVQKLHIK